MFTGAVNTINGVSPSGSVANGNNNTNKLFGIGGSTRSIYQTPEYKAYKAREDAAWAKMSWTEKICSFF